MAEGAADKALEVAPPAGRGTPRRGKMNILLFAGPAHPPAFLKVISSTGGFPQRNNKI